MATVKKVEDAPKKAAPRKPAARKAPAKKVGSPAAGARAGEAKFEIDYDAFTNTGEWDLYHANEFVRAKLLTEDAYVTDAKAHGKAGQFVVVGEDRKVRVLSEEDMNKAYYIIKGPHKRDF